MKFLLPKNISLILFAFLLTLNVIKTKSNLKAKSVSNNKLKSQTYMEPKTYTKLEKNFLSDLDNFSSELSNFDNKKYNDLLLFSSKVNNDDIVINNSGMKDHLFRFAQKGKFTEKINREKVF